MLEYENYEENVELQKAVDVVAPRIKLHELGLIPGATGVKKGI